MAETSSIQFFVPGIPAPGGSKRGFSPKGTSRVIITDACKRTKPWQAVVSAYAREAYQGPLLRGAIRMSVCFYFPRPKCHFGTGRNAAKLKPSAPEYWHTIKPDLTKIIRAAEDALKGILWVDDCLVAKRESEKKWTVGSSGVSIEISELANPRVEIEMIARLRVQPGKPNLVMPDEPVED